MSNYMSNKVVLYKTRPVGVCCQLKLRVHCEISFALVIKLETVKAISALAIIYNLKIKQFDVKCAYLYNKIKKKFML